MARADGGGPESAEVATYDLRPSPEGAYRQPDHESHGPPHSEPGSVTGGGVADDRSGAVSCALVCPHVCGVAGCVAIRRQEPVGHAASRRCPVLAAGREVLPCATFRRHGRAESEGLVVLSSYWQRHQQALLGA